jgi:heat shock protein HslJ
MRLRRRRERTLAPEVMEQENQLLGILPARFTVVRLDDDGLLLQSAEHSLRLATTA